MTDLEITLIEQHLEEIKKVIANKSGCLSPGLIKLIEELGFKYYKGFCVKCNAGRFNILSRLYHQYLEDYGKRIKKRKETKVSKNV